MPTADPAALPGAVELTSSPAIDVRLKTAATALAAVSVRPAFFQDGEWWPLGKDEVAGAAPVTCAGNGGKAHGRYTDQRTMLPWCLVLEGGNIDDIADAYLDGVDRI